MREEIWLEQMAHLADKNAFMRKQIEKLDPDAEVLIRELEWQDERKDGDTT